jgi:VIT1/CCC1 family predicted Fe2+/Mn2+ transporter
MEASAYATYMAQDRTARRMAPDEMEHQVTIDRMERPTPATSAGEAVRENWHRTGGGGVLRATVFGINDGLISNASLVMGFAGAQVPPNVVLLAGLAGLLAGAFSMAVGEYVSMRAQRELFEHQIAIEQRELAESPAEEEHELAAIYRAKGLPEEQARSLAGRLTRDPEVALDVLIREELGLDPTQLGSAWGAASGSFAAFAVGALVPVLPFLFAKGATVLPLIAFSAGLSGLTLFLVGALLSLFTGANPLFSGLRQLVLGAAAAALTFLLGSLLGRSIGL